MVGCVAVGLLGGWAWLTLAHGGAEPEHTEKLRRLRRLLTPTKRVIQMPQPAVNKIDRFKARLGSHTRPMCLLVPILLTVGSPEPGVIAATVQITAEATRVCVQAGREELACWGDWKRPLPERPLMKLWRWLPPGRYPVSAKVIERSGLVYQAPTAWVIVDAIPPLPEE